MRPTGSVKLKPPLGRPGLPGFAWRGSRIRLRKFAECSAQSAGPHWCPLVRARPLSRLVPSTVAWSLVGEVGTAGADPCCPSRLALPGRRYCRWYAPNQRAPQPSRRSHSTQPRMSRQRARGGGRSESAATGRLSPSAPPPCRGSPSRSDRLPRLLQAAARPRYR